MSHWAMDYMGQPWSPDGDGPDAFNCWGLFRHIQQVHYGRTVPIIQVDGHDLLQILRAFHDHPEYKRWREVDRPGDGDAVLMRRGRKACHIGAFIGVDGGLVLHSMEVMGVVAQALTELPPGIRVHSCWRFVGDPA